jgi:hypothetical protein
MVANVMANGEHWYGVSIDKKKSIDESPQQQQMKVLRRKKLLAAMCHMDGRNTVGGMQQTTYMSAMPRQVYISYIVHTALL